MTSSKNSRFKAQTQNYPDWDKNRQFQSNLTALKKLEKRRQEIMNISDEEAKSREEFFEEFRQIVDNNRPVGAKLYSEK